MNTTPDLAFAKTCEYCKDTCDSFGRYVSTYCHKHHVHLNGFADSNPSVCRSCPNYNSDFTKNPRANIRKDDSMIPYFYSLSTNEYITVYARTETFARRILLHINPDMAKKAVNIPWPTPDQHCIGEYGIYKINTKTNRYAACIKPAAIRDAQYTKAPSHEANPLDDEQWLDLEDSPSFITVIEAETEDDAITAAAKYADTAPDNIDVYKFNPLEQL